MSAELSTEDEAFSPFRAGEPDGHGRPNLSGDLPAVFQAAPMFRRAALGYDRFQVDTYVQWAEDELATAERERERLLTRQVETRAALEDARQLLAHSSSGAELLRISGRIGSMLAAAADEAEGMRAEAEGIRAEAEGMRAEAEGMRAEAEGMRTAASKAARCTVAEAERVLAESAAEAERIVATAAAQAGQTIGAAEQIRSEARVEAAARREETAALHVRAAVEAQRLRQEAVEEASAARVQARSEIVAMLAAGREERRRADDAATALRQRLDLDAWTRRAAVLAEVDGLELRRTALEAEVELLAAPLAAAPGHRRHLPLRGLRDRLRVPGPLAAAALIRGRSAPFPGRPPR
jgi:cell division septum initiation protein DivIVA